jgi:hypothetical protein
VHALDMLVPEAGAIYVMDRGYVDFGRGSSWVSGWWLRDQATRAPTSAARSCLPRLRAL